MANGFLSWLKKKGQQVENDVAHPVQQAAHAVANTVNNDVVHPVENATQQAAHTVNQDVVQPIEHTLPQAENTVDSAWQGVNRDVLHPIYRAPQNFENDVAAPVDRFADKSAVGRGAEDVGLGAYRAGVGLVQAASGLEGLAARHNPLNDVVPGMSAVDKEINKGTQALDKPLNSTAKLTDETVKQEGRNEGIYKGAQIVTNLLPAVLTGGGSEAAEGGAEGADAAANIATKLPAASKVSDALDAVENNNGVAGRVAVKTIRGAASPKALKANVAFQAYQAGQQSAKGEKVNPKSELEQLAAFQVGAPAAGAVGKEALDATAPVVKDAIAKGVDALKGRQPLGEEGSIKIPKSDEESLNESAPNPEEQSEEVVQPDTQTPAPAKTPTETPTENAQESPESIGQILDRTRGADATSSPERSLPEDRETNQELSSSDVSNTTSGKLSPEAYMQVFGVSRYQADKDLENMSAEASDHRSMTKEELSKLGPQEKLNTAQRRQLIATDARQATKNEVNLNPVTEDQAEGQVKGLGNKVRTKLGDTPAKRLAAKSAIAQAEGINQEAESRLGHAVTLGRNLSLHDQQLLYRYDAGEPLDDLAKEANKPAAFTKAASAYTDALDYDLAAQRAGGATTLRQANYVPHQYEVSQEWLDAHQIPEGQRIYQGKNVRGFRDTSAKYRSYKQAEEETKGALKPLKKSPVEDLADYQANAYASRRGNLLGAAIAKALPDDIAQRGQGIVGKKMSQAAGHLPFDVSDEAQKYLQGYDHLRGSDSIAGKIAGKVSNAANTATKRLLFLGTPFHYINEQASFVGKNLLNPVNLARGEKNFLSTVFTKGGYQKLIDAYRADGTLEAARKMGVILPDDSRLNRASSAFSLSEVKNQLKHGLDPESSKAVALGQQINHLMGHVNEAVEGHNPVAVRLSRLSALAPHWTTTQLSLLKDALTKGGEAGKYARGAVAGKRALLAGVGVGGSAALSHHLPNASQFWNEAGFTLKNPVPNVELNSKNKSGESQEMVTPTDQLGLATGLLTNPGHFLQSRESPALSFATKIATNQNWNGDPLAEGPHDAAYYKQLVENAAKNSFLPIGVQNLTNVGHETNNPSIVQGLEQDFGGRLKTNPNDPQYKQSVDYYNALDSAMDSLTPNSQAMGAFLENAGITKDPVTGKYLMTPNSEMTVAKSASLNAFPAANAALTKMYKTLAAKGQKVDPYYLLTPTQQKAYNAYETMAPLSADRTNWENNNKWFNAFETKQQAYFNSLPAGDPNKPQNPIKYPTFDKQTNSDLNTYYALSNSQARDTFLDSHPNVGQALNQQFNYDNAVRVARGYAPLKGYPQPNAQLQAELNTYDTLSKSDASAYASAHPEIYGFFELASEYDLNKDASLNEIQGNDLTPAEVKTINSLGEDIYYDGGLIGDNGQLVAPTGSTGASGGSGGSSSDDNSPGDLAADQLYFMTSQKKPSIASFSPKGITLAAIKKPTYHIAAPKKPSNYGLKPALTGVKVTKGAKV